MVKEAITSACSNRPLEFPLLNLGKRIGGIEDNEAQGLRAHLGARSQHSYDSGYNHYGSHQEVKRRSDQAAEGQRDVKHYRTLVEQLEHSGRTMSLIIREPTNGLSATDGEDDLLPNTLLVVVLCSLSSGPVVPKT